MILESTIFATLLQTFLGGATSVDEIHVLGRTYSESCSYYSRTVTDLDIYFTDSVMTNFKSVEMIHGFGGWNQRVVDGNPVQQEYDWKDHRSVPLNLIGRGVWNAKIQKDVHFRSSERFYSTLQFVFKLTTQDNQVVYEKGSPTARGFYTTDLPGVSQCVDDPTSVPKFTHLTIKPIDRN